MNDHERISLLLTRPHVDRLSKRDQRRLAFLFPHSELSSSQRSWIQYLTKRLGLEPKE
jgi:hypothetical protein